LGVISPISSSISVPPSASSKRPSFVLCAPVNAPRSWPKSSDSSSCSDSAAQLTRMNGPFWRGELWWMKCATRSLPVPDSPVIKTVPLLRAMRAAVRRVSSIAGLFATIVEGASPLTSVRRYWFSRISRVVRSMRSMTNSIASAVHGLSRKSDAPWRIACTADSIVPCAVIITDGMSGESSRIFLTSSMPSMPGMRRSVKRRSGLACCARSRASCPFFASIGL
jgi:hypothetical protein